MSSSKLIYSKETLRGLNNPQLKVIPTDDDRYDLLRRFFSQETRSNLAKVVKRLPPSHFRYGDGQHSSHKQQANLVRGAPRRKLGPPKGDGVADVINAKIRDILSKLSEKTKIKLLEDLRQCEIPDDCGPVLIENVYSFSMDINYLVKIFVEVMAILKDKNTEIYHQLMDKIIQQAHEPLKFDDEGKTKRWRIANLHLMAELYIQGNPEINLEVIDHYLQSLFKVMSPEHPESLEMSCELVKLILPHVMQSNPDLAQVYVKKISPRANDRTYDIRFRFLAQDVIDCYENVLGSDEEED